MQEIKAILTDDKWKSFEGLMNEMIVTRTGRKLFPVLEYRFEGLNPDAYYMIYMSIERADDQKYKFSAGEWQTTGLGDHIKHYHNSGPMALNSKPCLGSQLMQGKKVFDLKITNSVDNQQEGMVLLETMYKYRPTVYVFMVSHPFVLFDPRQLPHNHEATLVAKITHSVTEFIAVTAYQNSAIKDQKVDLNPFARGFKNTGERKRKSSSPSSNESSPKMRKEQMQMPSYEEAVRLQMQYYNYQYGTFPYFMNSMNSMYFQQPSPFPGFQPDLNQFQPQYPADYSAVVPDYSYTHL